jgi:hypothetical protein
MLCTDCTDEGHVCHHMSQQNSRPTGNNRDYGVNMNPTIFLILIALTFDLHNSPDNFTVVVSGWCYFRRSPHGIATIECFAKPTPLVTQF